MSCTLVRYRAKPEKIEENERHPAAWDGNLRREGLYHPVADETETAATPNGFMASRIQGCAYRTRSQFMQPTYGAP